MAYKDFYYSSPTIIYYGKNSIKSIEKHVACGSHVLLLYSSDFIKKIGIYKDIIDTISSLNVRITEIDNCRPNPKIDYIQSIGNELIDVDYILAIGGGSVIDAAKALSLFFNNKIDFEKKLLLNTVENATTPIGVISTVPASGSENNSSFVISDPKKYGKIARANLTVRPKFAILNPSYLKSLSIFQLKSSLGDVLSHLLEQYFVLEDDVYFVDEQLFGAIRCYLYLKVKILNGDVHEESLGNFMLLASQALSYQFSIGRTADWNVHSIEHGIHSQFEVMHGVSISILYPAYLKIAMSNKVYKKRLQKLGLNVFEMKPDIDPAQVVQRIDEEYRSLLLPKNFEELCSNTIDFRKLSATLFSKDKSIGKIFKINNKVLKKIIDQIE